MRPISEQFCELEMESRVSSSRSTTYVWFTKSPQPYRLCAGDVSRFESRLCRVLCVNECAAVVLYLGF